MERANSSSDLRVEAPWGRRYARLQLLTIADLLAGKTVDFPRENVTFKKAPKAEPPETETEPLPF